MKSISASDLSKCVAIKFRIRVPNSNYHLTAQRGFSEKKKMKKRKKKRERVRQEDMFELDRCSKEVTDPFYDLLASRGGLGVKGPKICFAPRRSRRAG